MVQTVWFPSFRSLISVILAGICLGWIVDARLSHGIALELDAVGGIQYPVQERICDGRIFDCRMPHVNWSLLKAINPY